MLLGPAEYGGVAAVGEIEVRRYQCQRCRAVVVVCPRAVRPRHLYTAVAIALSLSLWTEGLAAHEVRRGVSPFAVVGQEACRGWRSLRRWARAGPELWPRLRLVSGEPPRAVAAELVRRLASHAPVPAGVLSVDACAGAVVA